MHYFSLSPFYDRQSNNEVVRMQTQFADARAVPLDVLATTLSSMTGLEYVVSHHQPDAFFVIKSRLRKSPEEGIFTIHARFTKNGSCATMTVQDLAAFCVLNGVIFPLPSLYAILQHRIVLASLPRFHGIQRLMVPSVHGGPASCRDHLKPVWSMVLCQC